MCCRFGLNIISRLRCDGIVGPYIIIYIYVCVLYMILHRCVNPQYRCTTRYGVGGWKVSVRWDENTKRKTPQYNIVVALYVYNIVAVPYVDEIEFDEKKYTYRSCVFYFIFNTTIYSIKSHYLCLNLLKLVNRKKNVNITVVKIG